MFCITKIHILVLVSTMNICIAVATIYKFYDHEEEKKKGYLLRQLKKYVNIFLLLKQVDHNASSSVMQNTPVKRSPIQKLLYLSYASYM